MITYGEQSVILSAAKDLTKSFCAPLFHGRSN